MAMNIELDRTFPKMPSLTVLTLVALPVLIAALFMGAVATKIPDEPFSTPGYVLLPPAPPQEQSGETTFFWSQQPVLRVRLFNPESFDKHVRFSFKVHATPCDGEDLASVLIKFRGHRTQLTFTEAGAGSFVSPEVLNPGETEIVTLKTQRHGCRLPDGREVFFWLGDVKPT